MSRLLTLLIGAAALALATMASSATASPFGATRSALLGDAQPAFLTVEQAYRAELSVSSGDPLQLATRWQIAPGYYLYQKQFAVATGDGRIGALTFEPGEELWDEFFQEQLVVYRDTTTVRASLSTAVPVPATAAHATSGSLTVTLRSQGCADAGLCYPPREQWFAIDLDSGAVSELAAAPQAGVEQLPATAPLSWSLLAAVLLAALAGGAILNLMPCVFPVLSIKLLSLTQHNHSRHPAWLHGLLYSAGVVASFVAIAALMLALRSAGAAIGWGFQLQSPLFVAALAALFVAMACNLFGLFQVSFGNPSVNPAPTLPGAFASGVLATLVASPCTAPFMGSALGFAITQSSAVALLVFAALGAGMALPFLLLTLSPRLAAALPKPGEWMERFKQLLGFPLLLTAIWLLWVFGGQTSIDQLALLLVALTLLALAGWAWGLVQRQPNRSRAILLALAIAATAASGYQALQTPQQADWQSYSPALLQELRNSGSPVLINLTADWCVTCLVNERRALSGEPFRQLLEETGTIYLKGDWSDPDPVITALLNAHGRNGVPLYLLYRAGASEAEILPQILSPGLVAQVLRQVR